MIIDNIKSAILKSINSEDSKNLAAPIRTTAAYSGIAQNIINPDV